MKHLADISFHEADPLARILIDRLRLTPVTSAILAGFGAFAVTFLVALFTGTLSTSPGEVGYLEDWTNWLSIILFTPVLAGYYVWASDTARDILLSLEDSDVVDILDSDVKTVLVPYQKPWRMILSIIGGLTVGGLFYFTRTNLAAWSSRGPIQELTTTSGMLAGGYMTTMLGLTLLLNVWMIWKILHNKKFRLRPLHSDQSGGLGMLSSYSLKTVYLAAVAGLVIGFAEYRFITQGMAQEHPEIHLSIPLYLIWTTLGFLAPLFTAHQGMKAARDEKLNEIAQQYLMAYTDAGKNLANSSDDLEEGISKIKRLEDLYEITKRFPVWPFNVASLRKFFLSISAPFIPLLAAWVVDELKKVVTL